jgi:hypothetical protein
MWIFKIIQIIFTEEEIERRKCELREKNRRDRVAIVNYAVKQAITKQEQKYAQEEENRIISLIRYYGFFFDFQRTYSANS